MASIVGTQRDRAGYHALGVAGFILVHLLLFALLIQNGQSVIAALPTVRETILILIPQHPRIVPQKTVPNPRATTRTKSSASPAQPSWQPPAVLPQDLQTPTNLNGLATALFDCAPENIGNLPREDRSACVNASKMAAFKGPPLDTVRVLSKDGALWAAGIADRNTPLRVPCVGFHNQVANGISGKGKVELIVDPICAASLALHAKELLRKTHLSD